ncbi:SDR family NAD(P)-dependent oxidoreductase [Agromyces silvae]|uniref:SDR family NAD(P)-dependent oxidoreductase n=1 Tax=Agromyces silvae TaxID=3388266 RepID=UPI00280B6D0C|nr:SDR family NAD(P)-dependent oxidoreductase [Agromyces protaetiae]
MTGVGVAVVTGAAGGIGAEVVRRLVRRFGTVVAADLRGAATEWDSAAVVGVDCDVSSTDSVEGVVALAGTRGELRAVVTCAGVVSVGTLPETTDDQWDGVLDINLGGTMRVCRAAIPRLAPGSAIVTVASISGRTASTFASPAYVASKAGVIGLTKSLAAQLGEAGIRVNAVAPGIIDTPMIASYGDDRKALLRSRIPAGRLGAAEDVARTIEFLATPDSDFVTGAVIDVNGGQFIA